MNTIKETVDLAIAAAGPKIQELLVQHMVQTEVNKRIASIAAAMKKLGDLQKWMNQYEKPDIITYSPEGKEIASFSEKRWKDYLAYKERVATLELSIDTALTDNSAEAYKALDTLVEK